MGRSVETVICYGRKRDTTRFLLMYVQGLRMWLYFTQDYIAAFMICIFNIAFVLIINVDILKDPEYILCSAMSDSRLKNIIIFTQHLQGYRIISCS